MEALIEYITSKIQSDGFFQRTLAFMGVYFMGYGLAMYHCVKMWRKGHLENEQRKRDEGRS